MYEVKKKPDCFTSEVFTDDELIDFAQTLSDRPENIINTYYAREFLLEQGYYAVRKI